jgi:hypothetical protein
MLSGILAVITFLSQLIPLVFRIWDTIKESNDEKKKQKTEALQSGVRAIVDKDASRLNDSIRTLNSLR